MYIHTPTICHKNKVPNYIMYHIHTVHTVLGTPVHQVVKTIATKSTDKSGHGVGVTVTSCSQEPLL